MCANLQSVNWLHHSNNLIAVIVGAKLFAITYFIGKLEVAQYNDTRHTKSQQLLSICMFSLLWWWLKNIAFIPLKTLVNGSQVCQVIKDWNIKNSLINSIDQSERSQSSLKLDWLIEEVSSRNCFLFLKLFSCIFSIDLQPYPIH